MLKLITLLFCVCTMHVQAQTYFNKTYDYDSLINGTFNVIQTSDSNFISVGLIYNLSQGYHNTVIYKLNNLGDTIWRKVYSLSSTGAETPSDVFPLPNGSFIAGGTLQDSIELKGDYFLFMFDSVGNFIWKKQYGVPFNDYCQSIHRRNNGDIILAGSSYDSLNTVLSANLICVDSLGVIIWNKRYSIGTSYAEFYDAKQSSDGGIIAVGRVRSTSNDFSSYMVKTDVNGDTLWTRIFNLGNTTDAIFGLDLMPNGDIVLAGGMIVNNGPGSGYVMRCDSTGNIIWEKNYYMGPYDAEFQDILVDSNYNIYCVGEHFDLSLANPRPSGWLAKIDFQTGDTIWNRTYRYYPSCDHYLFSLNQTIDNGFIMGGYSITGCSPTLNDIWIIKVDSNGCETTGCFTTAIKEIEKIDWRIYPNPADNDITIKFTKSAQEYNEIILTSTLSQIIFKISLSLNEMEYKFNVNHLPDGIYNIIFLSKSGLHQAEKIIVQHVLK